MIPNSIGIWNLKWRSSFNQNTMDTIVTVTEKRLQQSHQKSGQDFETSKTFDVSAKLSFPKGDKQHANYKAFGENPTGSFLFQNLPEQTADLLEVGKEYSVTIAPVAK